MAAGRNRAALGLLATLALAACASPTPREAGPRPALWQVADEDTKIYLFGTFHLLPKDYRWRTPRLDSAMAESAELVTELGTLDDPMAGMQTIVSLGVSPNLPPLAERVPEEKRDELRQMIAESGVPEAALDRLETWAAAISLLGVTFKRLGLDAEAGVEHGLEGVYKSAGKPIRGLETVRQQLGFFDSLPEADQRAFLVAMLDDPAELKRMFDRMVAAWSSGDVDAIAATFNDDVNVSPALREILLRRRNAAWADWLRSRLEKPGTIFVAVGAGHLAGPDSVQAMLKAKGLKAKRLQ